jgi:hypothetical protein
MPTQAVLAAPAPVDTTPGRSYKNFYEARDALSAALRAGEMDDLSGTDVAVLRVLIENTIFDRRANDYGWVASCAIGVENLMTLTRFGRTAVNSALRQLKAGGLITVARRPKITGGSLNAAIRVNGLTDDTPEVVEPRVRETTPPERSRDDLYERPGDDRSSSIEEELIEEPQPVAASPEGQRQAHAPAGAGHGPSVGSLSGLGDDCHPTDVALAAQKARRRARVEAALSEMDDLLSAASADVLDRLGGKGSVKNDFGYFTRRPDVEGLRALLALMTANPLHVEPAYAGQN